MPLSPVALRWAALVALSLIISLALRAAGLPAALLIGPMLAAIILAARGHALRVPSFTFVAAQGVIGVMIAGFLPLSVGQEIADRWPIFALGTFSTLFASTLLGWGLTRFRLLPGTTGIWGSSPGAATVMTLMSEHYGADLRLVALMQYLRVACCAAVAALMAHWLGAPLTSPQGPTAQASLQTVSVAATLLIAFGGAFLGLRSRVPAGAMLLPMAIGLLVKALGLVAVALPSPVLMLCYAFLGWGLGMRFTPEVIGHAARLLPRIIASTLALIAICSVFGLVLARLADIDLLTAVLATSPGGADTVTIIASTTKVDAPFVIAMQIVRFFCVLFTGPALAKFLSRPKTREEEARSRS